MLVKTSLLSLVITFAEFYFVPPATNSTEEAVSAQTQRSLSQHDYRSRNQSPCTALRVQEKHLGNSVKLVVGVKLLTDLLCEQPSLILLCSIFRKSEGDSTRRVSQTFPVRSDRITSLQPTLN